MTPKQHQFAREVVLGKSQADAYRSAYNTAGMNDNSTITGLHPTSPVRYSKGQHHGQVNYPPSHTDYHVYSILCPDCRLLTATK